MPTLPERLLLLSLDDDGQPRDPRSTLGYALAGAAVGCVQQEIMAAITVAIAASAAASSSGGSGQQVIWSIGAVPASGRVASAGMPAHRGRLSRLSTDLAPVSTHSNPPCTLPA
jgi:hypothetical protein